MCSHPNISAIFTMWVRNNNNPHTIKAVPVEVSLLEAEIPLELLLSLNDFPRVIRAIEMIITTPFIIKEDITSDTTRFPQNT